VEEDTVKAELLTLKLSEREEKRLLNLTRGGNSNAPVGGSII